MNFTRNKMILYMLIIANGIDFILVRFYFTFITFSRSLINYISILCCFKPWPIFQRHVNDDSYTQNLKTTSVVQESRYSRQVVQPTWLNVGQKEPDVDPTVYVNEKSLQEADEIRKAIQKAVDEGTFFVTGEEVNNDNYINIDLYS